VSLKNRQTTNSAENMKDSYYILAVFRSVYRILKIFYFRYENVFLLPSDFTNYIQRYGTRTAF